MVAEVQGEGGDVYMGVYTEWWNRKLCFGRLHCIGRGLDAMKRSER
jgi:hypothetical protein